MGGILLAARQKFNISYIKSQVSHTVGSLLIRAITFKIPYGLKFHKSEFIINHKNIHSCSETILSHHHHTDREPRIQQVTLPWVMVT